MCGWRQARGLSKFETFIMFSGLAFIEYNSVLAVVGCIYMTNNFEQMCNNIYSFAIACIIHQFIPCMLLLMFMLSGIHHRDVPIKKICIMYGFISSSFIGWGTNLFVSMDSDCTTNLANASAGFRTYFKIAYWSLIPQILVNLFYILYQRKKLPGLNTIVLANPLTTVQITQLQPQLSLEDIKRQHPHVEIKI